MHERTTANRRIIGAREMAQKLEKGTNEGIHLIPQSKNPNESSRLKPSPRSNTVHKT